MQRADKTEPASSEIDYLADALAKLSQDRRAMAVLRYYERADSG